MFLICQCLPWFHRDETRVTCGGLTEEEIRIAEVGARHAVPLLEHTLILSKGSEKFVRSEKGIHLKEFE